METTGSSERLAVTCPNTRPHIAKYRDLKITDYYMGDKEDRQCMFNVF
jgi:hypothetical protein